MKYNAFNYRNCHEQKRAVSKSYLFQVLFHFLWGVMRLLQKPGINMWARYLIKWFDTWQVDLTASVEAEPSDEELPRLHKTFPLRLCQRRFFGAGHMCRIRSQELTLTNCKSPIKPSHILCMKPDDNGFQHTNLCFPGRAWTLCKQTILYTW